MKNNLVDYDTLDNSIDCLLKYILLTAESRENTKSLKHESLKIHITNILKKCNNLHPESSVGSNTTDGIFTCGDTVAIAAELKDKKNSAISLALGSIKQSFMYRTQYEKRMDDEEKRPNEYYLNPDTKFVGNMGLSVTN